jgi:hypothetical protein
MRIHRSVSTRKQKKAFEKKPAAPTADMRPHRYITICGRKLSYDDESLITPCRRTLDYVDWTNEQAENLIEKYALVAQRYNRKWHDIWQREMKREIRLFRRAWRSQHGKCAITGIPLLGGPGLVGHGIGIDVIEPEVGIKKGNIRLVSIPMALSRLSLPNLTPKGFPDYGDLVMTKVLAKSLIPRLYASRVLQRGPLQYDLTPSHTIVEIKLSLQQPTATTERGYRNAKTIRAETILDVKLIDDHLYCKTLENTGFAKSGYMSRRSIIDIPKYAATTLDINLNDPIDPVAPIVPLAEASFLIYARHSILQMTADLLDFYA